MTLDDIRAEHQAHGRLRAGSIQALRTWLTSRDPFSAITVVGDLRVAELADDVARCLDAEDPMVRWNAVSVLTTWLRSSPHAERVLQHTTAETEPDEMVRGAGLAGLGAVLRTVPAPLARRIGTHLLEVLEDASELIELRGAAYEGILTALDVPPNERPSAAKLIDLDADVSTDVMTAFERLCKEIA
jgi:hypothetical protein